MPGDIVCRACQFSFDDHSVALAKRRGKDKPQRMRNYSHFVRADGTWEPLTKGEKPRMRELLTVERTLLVVIADSGQRHLIFRSAPGWWQFEERRIKPDSFWLAQLTGELVALLRSFSKAEVASGTYRPERIRDYGRARWFESEALIRSSRGSDLFNLALFLAQKEDADEEASEN